MSGKLHDPALLSLTAEARVQSQAIPCGICGDKSGICYRHDSYTVFYRQYQSIVAQY